MSFPRALGALFFDSAGRAERKANGSGLCANPSRSNGMSAAIYRVRVDTGARQLWSRP
jgi:hypothetical protein